jgi:hypothetical protein
MTSALSFFRPRRPRRHHLREKKPSRADKKFRKSSKEVTEKRCRQRLWVNKQGTVIPHRGRPAERPGSCITSDAAAYGETQGCASCSPSQLVPCRFHLR